MPRENFDLKQFREQIKDEFKNVYKKVAEQGT